MDNDNHNEARLCLAGSQLQAGQHKVLPVPCP